MEKLLDEFTFFFIPGSEDEACQQQGHFSSSNHVEGKLFKSLVNTPNS